ncbi:hypothetical protein A1332_21560 [Methylomonas methanica]|uniref:Uncharacterized protein n=1 Tax=Methylomonas methanica TaxID=421 RepID=A0A177LXJ3_METMH|nr:hypothetical protein A1332_21560 [Methylomonas methanica]
MLTFHRFVSVPYIYNWTLRQAKSLLEYSRFDAIGRCLLNGSNRPTARNHERLLRRSETRKTMFGLVAALEKYE